MNAVVNGLGTVIVVLRPALFWLAVALAAVVAIDWAVRTRRISPFSGVARFFRSWIDPMLTPVERAVVRAGGAPSSAPWWALVFVVLGGIVLLGLLDFVRDQLYTASFAAENGARGVAAVAIHWVFEILLLALIVRVISSWVRGNPRSRWWRWAFVLTEPILRPLRAVIPPIGMIDVTPIVAWIILMLLQSLVLGVL